MIKRLIFNTLQHEIDQPHINVLLGPRQVGKTTLLRALEAYAQKEGLPTAFFDLEQPQVLADFNQPETAIIKKIAGAGKIVLIDEFQYLSNASKIFKAIFDAGRKVKIFCSGSSSLEIHKHLKESLAGRRFLFRIYPLQFTEIKAHFPSFVFDDYLCYGGLPALTATESSQRKQQILDELLSSFILKDVKSLVKEENIRAFNHLLYLLAQGQGAMLSAHSLSNEINMSAKAVMRYFDILEQTYVHFRVYSFSNNLGNELKKSFKGYLYDLGIRNAILKDFSSIKQRPDKGVLHETFVFLKLQTLLRPNMEIKFWRTKDGDEVDFVLLKDRRPIPIEVKSAMANAEVPKGLKRFLARYPDVKTAYVVNESFHSEIDHQGTRVHFVTFEDFHESLNL